ncbi:MAG: hypothetical protein LAO09_04820 [Acidobacteriia bacterium]|nr:hypothetical protein [Terriglobia bacterium]
MRNAYRGLFLVLSLILAGCFVVDRAKGQSNDSSGADFRQNRVQTLGAMRSGLLGPNSASAPINPNTLTCSPAPCVLPLRQVSEGGFLVNTTPVVADPLTPKHLLMGANDFNCPGSTGPLAAYTSANGGSTWAGPFCMAGGVQRGGRSYYPSINPAVGYDRNGAAYLAGDYFDNYTGDTGFVGFEKSSDGVNWSKAGVALGPPNTSSDFPWLAVDTNVGSPYVNSVYVSAMVTNDIDATVQIAVAHSNDGGANWSTASVDPPQAYPADDGFTNLAVGKDGTVYVTWQHCVGSGPAAFCANGTAYMLLSTSTDGGNTWSHPRLMTAVILNNDACRCLWGDLPNTDGIRVSNYPVIGVDNSDGPYAGNLYVVMYSWTGSYMRVGVIRSTDGGNTWSKPVPVAPPSANHDQFFPWLSVSPTGLVGVSWLDRRNDPANVNYQPFAAISTDGGQTFKPNVLLSKAFSNPNNNGYPGNSWMGDYTGNTWAGPNFLAAWMDSSNGVDMQVMVGGIRLK